jgi:hypothetical protein
MDFKLLVKMSLYVFVSTIISFVSLLDTLDAHYFDQVSNLDWIKIFLKSLAPGLISMKAFLDTSINDNNNNNQNIPPQNNP